MPSHLAIAKLAQMLDLLKQPFRDRRMLIIFVLGFSSGVPLLLTGSTLQAWCKDGKMDLTQIGLFALVGLPYTLKFLWSPFLDHFRPPFLGRRRGWLLITQAALLFAIAALGLCHPESAPIVLAATALTVAFFSATQDIAIDAYQIEILEPEAYALGNQLYVVGYRIGMLVTGAGAMILADRLPWPTVFFSMSSLMLFGIAATAFAPEPILHSANERSLLDSIWLPLKDFFSKSGSHHGKALWILAFFLLYKIGGDMATGLTTPFYMELGFSKTQIGTVVKVFGLGATMFGGLLGATGVLSLGIRKSLWIFGIIQALANLSFAALASYVHHTGQASTVALATAISIENLAAGLGTAAYGCYMASLVNRKFTATQYALLSSLMGATRVFSATPTGWLASHLGWISFFMICSLASIPGLLVLLKLDQPPAPADRATKPTELLSPLESSSL